jgi:hypothetical protein
VGFTGPTGPTGPTGSFSVNAWLLTGNSGTDPSVNFIGTTDNTPVIVATNSNTTLPRIRFTDLGQIEPLNTNRSVFLGESAGAVDTGAANVFVGYQAGLANTTGSTNTVVGASAFSSNTIGFNNVAVGQMQQP